MQPYKCQWRDCSEAASLEGQAEITRGERTGGEEQWLLGFSCSRTNFHSSSVKGSVQSPALRGPLSTQLGGAPSTTRCGPKQPNEEIQKVTFGLCKEFSEEQIAGFH